MSTESNAACAETLFSCKKDEAVALKQGKEKGKKKKGEERKSKPRQNKNYNLYFGVMPMDFLIWYLLQTKVHT